jgi:hypothetical protein
MLRTGTGAQQASPCLSGLMRPSYLDSCSNGFGRCSASLRRWYGPPQRQVRGMRDGSIQHQAPGRSQPPTTANATQGPAGGRGRRYPIAAVWRPSSAVVVFHRPQPGRARPRAARAALVGPRSRDWLDRTPQSYDGIDMDHLCRSGFCRSELKSCLVYGSKLEP